MKIDRLLLNAPFMTQSYSIKLSSKAATGKFVERLVSKADEFGTLDSGREALTQFLLEVKEIVGTDQHAKIRRLLLRIAIAKADIFQPVSIDTSEIDLRILRELWQYINWTIIGGIIDGYRNMWILEGHLANFYEYFQKRRNPKFSVYDQEIEQKLTSFENSLYSAIMLSSHMITTSPKDENFRVAVFESGKYKYREFPEMRKQYRQFLENNLQDTESKYKELIALLKERQILHLLTWQDDETCA